MRELSGWKGRVVGSWLTGVSVFAIYTATFGVMQPRIQRGIHLLFLLPMAFILFPATKRASRGAIPIYDWIMAMLALGSFILCAHRDLVAQPVTLMAATAIILTFLYWVFVQRRRPNPVTIAN